MSIGVTIVILKEIQDADLDNMGGELIARSQAKSIVSKFGPSDKVELDFHSIDFIGQGFADELARVWPLVYKDAHLTMVNCGENVWKMLSHVACRYDLPQPNNVTILKTHATNYDTAAPGI